MHSYGPQLGCYMQPRCKMCIRDRGYCVPAPSYHTWSEIKDHHMVGIVDTEDGKMSWFGLYMRTRQGGEESEVVRHYECRLRALATGDS